MPMNFDAIDVNSLNQASKTNLKWEVIYQLSIHHHSFSVHLLFVTSQFSKFYINFITTSSVQFQLWWLDKKCKINRVKFCNSWNREMFILLTSQLLHQYYRFFYRWKERQKKCNWYRTVLVGCHIYNLYYYIRKVVGKVPIGLKGGKINK
jgi:hypothetical protein